MPQTLNALFNDWFLRGMVAAVLIASFLPDLGRSGGWLHLDVLLDGGIALVFFLHGIGIPTEKMKAGISNWRLHLVVQGFTFVFFPLLYLALQWPLAQLLPPMLLLGFLYLAVLPSTITSSVAMTAIARGNVPAAIFNATLSSLIGIVLTPALVGLLLTNAPAGLHVDVLGAMQKIAVFILLPFVAGQVLHRWLGEWFAARKRWTSLMDRSVILLLVLSSFSDSVAAGLWTDYGAGLLLLTLAASAVFLAIVLATSTAAARALKFNTEDEITAVFCGSKKTLAAGLPMAKVLFGAHPALGLIVLPIMFYHQLQLIVCAAMAQRYARREG
ncbi:MAG: bile acid:sodium symporter family protein [Moraxellaceae bacterium]|nr:bile acid:sodium symporter family protein [Moraxellaceae bacterium]